MRRSCAAAGAGDMQVEESNKLNISACHSSAAREVLRNGFTPDSLRFSNVAVVRYVTLCYVQHQQKETNKYHFIQPP